MSTAPYSSTLVGTSYMIPYNVPLYISSPSTSSIPQIAQVRQVPQVDQVRQVP